jgi:hypothetical protein
MHNTLDVHQLEERVAFLRENFERDVARVRSVMTGYLDRWITEALDRISYESDERFGATHSDAAAQIVGSVAQAVANCDLQRLQQDAGDLSIALSTLAALREFAEVEPEAADAIRGWADARKERADAKKAAEAKARAEKEARQCQAQVHDSGRGAGFHQCQRPGPHTIEYDDGFEYRCCKTHLVGFRPYTKETR